MRLSTLAVSFFVFLSLQFSASAEDGNYCLALRGNGESQPAHWGALANLVEKKGLPEAQAGGSSASISLMLLEAIAENPWVRNASREEQKSRASFLLKSLHGTTIYLRKAFTNSIGLEKWLGGLSSEPVTNKNLLKILKAIAPKPSSKYSYLLQKLQAANLGQKLTDDELKKVKFYSDDFKQAVITIGAFDAESDPGIFFREGVVDFEKLAVAIGKIATFYSGENWNNKTKKAFEKLVQNCEPLHKGITWQKLAAQSSKCQKYLDQSVAAFYKQDLNWEKVNFVLRKIGNTISSYPTTAVLIGSAYEEAERSFREYHDNLDRSVANRFRITNIDDVKLGYWGPEAKLNTVANNFKTPFSDKLGRRFDFRSDAKSAMFLGLGEASWIEVLKLSPAEPGLASILPMTVNGKRALSAGGWSDLHPVLVLKASGCDRVVYVTRKGGESLFAQGVAKRLLNFERSWEFLRTSEETAKAKNKILNDQGDKSDMTSLWSRLYNLANRESSFVKSLETADSVLCTDWNRFDVKKDLPGLVEDSYLAPFDLAVAGCRP